MSKVIIISAPSGTGKSTIVKRLMEEAPDLRLCFSISATTRAPRGQEKNGKDYYFYTVADFRELISENDLLEWQEVYPGRYYGTLKTEVDRIREEGDNIIFDVDCRGGINIKKYYQEEALSIFLLPPTLDDLRERLEKRGTDSPEMIEIRLEKAHREIAESKHFDEIIVNEDLDTCYHEVETLIRSFVNQ